MRPSCVRRDDEKCFSRDTDAPSTSDAGLDVAPVGRARQGKPWEASTGATHSMMQPSSVSPLGEDVFAKASPQKGLPAYASLHVHHEVILVGETTGQAAFCPPQGDVGSVESPRDASPRDASLQVEASYLTTPSQRTGQGSPGSARDLLSLSRRVLRRPSLLDDQDDPSPLAAGCLPASSPSHSSAHALPPPPNELARPLSTGGAIPPRASSAGARHMGAEHAQYGSPVLAAGALSEEAPNLGGSSATSSIASRTEERRRASTDSSDPDLPDHLSTLFAPSNGTHASAETRTLQVPGGTSQARDKHPGSTASAAPGGAHESAALGQQRFATEGGRHLARSTSGSESLGNSSPPQRPLLSTPVTVAAPRS